MHAAEIDLDVAELICTKFARKTCLVPRWDEFEDSSKRGTKHVFPVNLAQNRSPVSEIFNNT